MNLGTKRQWLRLALGMAALLFFGVSPAPVG